MQRFVYDLCPKGSVLNVLESRAPAAVRTPAGMAPGSLQGATAQVVRQGQPSTQLGFHWGVGLLVFLLLLGVCVKHV